jgi:hypothetical protein
MDAELRLTQAMLAAGGRHTDYKAGFRKFRQAAREAFQSNVRYAPLPVTLGEIVDGYKFPVEMAGRTAWLVYSIKLDETDTAIGYIGCFMPRMEGSGAAISVGRFTFSKQGDTNLNAPDNEEGKLNIFNPAGAAYAVLYCLRLVMKRDWE